MKLTTEQWLERFGKDKVCHNCTHWDNEGYCDVSNDYTRGIQAACEHFINIHGL